MTPIYVETFPDEGRPHVYSMKVFHKEYLYFDEMELAAGYCYHVLMSILENADREVMREEVMKVLSGDTGKIMERNMQQQLELEKLREKLDNVQQENYRINKQLIRLKNLKSKDGVKRNIKGAPEHKGGREREDWKFVED